MGKADVARGGSRKIISGDVKLFVEPILDKKTTKKDDFLRKIKKVSIFALAFAPYAISAHSSIG